MAKKAKLTMKQLADRMKALEATKRPNFTIDGGGDITKQRLDVLGDLAAMGREITAALRATSGPTLNLQAPVTCNDLTIGGALDSDKGEKATVRRNIDYPDAPPDSRTE